MSGKSFLLGYSMAVSSADNVEKIINMCNENALPFSSMMLQSQGESAENNTSDTSEAKDKRACFCVPLFCEWQLLKLAKSRGIEITVISRRGIPALLFRYKMRIGIFIGLFLCILCYGFISELIWDIRIDGAITVSERELRKTFNECGLYVGARLDDIDADVLEHQILILTDDISWISVNLINNVASVEIREIDYAPPNDYGDALYSNVTAAENGIIVGFEDVKGDISVEIGEAVCRDQILISGILGGEGEPTRLTDAHGRVLAEVEELIEIEIPQKYIKKVTKNNVKTEKSLFFFKNEIKFFSNSGNLYPFYDKIDIVENFYTINHTRLPIGVKAVKYIEYEEIEVMRSKEKMVSLAYSELYRHISLHYSDVEILSRAATITEENDKLILSCRLICVKNIAQIKEIIVSD